MRHYDLQLSRKPGSMVRTYLTTLDHASKVGLGGEHLPWLRHDILTWKQVNAQNSHESSKPPFHSSPPTAGIKPPTRDNYKVTSAHSLSLHQDRLLVSRPFFQFLFRFVTLFTFNQHLIQHLLSFAYLIWFPLVASLSLPFTSFPAPLRFPSATRFALVKFHKVSESFI
jgi:hypothetical protein